ncbi:MAG: zinc-ribbon domain-containing protein [Deltaproteobacteria bacterium]|nr:zinc-ribbon domain-containing protein [Deltaproteobacteria bacterium]
MEIICDKCQHSLNLPDDKIPEGRTATLRCPTCKNKITVSREKKEDEFGFETDGDDIATDGDDIATDGDDIATDGDDIATDEGGTETADGKDSEFVFEDDYSEEYEQSDRMFDFIEDEGKTALVCEVDKSVKEKIKPVLDFMEYHIVEVNSAREAIKKLRYHVFDIIIINEEFDTRDPDANGVLIYLSRMQMLERRKIFVAMLSQRFQTMDHMTALHKSVNMTINLENLDDIEKILKHGLSDSDIFYRLFMENLKNTGRV